MVTQCSTDAPQALLSNVYGPTEADITYWEAPAPRGVGCVPPPIQQVPIGRAVDHVRVVVLNSSKDDVVHWACQANWRLWETSPSAI